MARFGLRYGNGWIPLSPGSFTIGRSHDCNLFLDDAGASRTHAMLVVGADGADLVDAGSHNGTLLNGTAVEGRVALKHGDLIEIGAQRLVFEDDRENQEDEETGERKRRRLRETMRVEAPANGMDDQGTDGGSRPDTALVEEAQQMLAQDDPAGAMGLMSIVVQRLVTSGKKNKPVEPQILNNAARCLVDLAAGSEQWEWVERLFEVYRAQKAMVPGNVVDVVHVLASELSPRRSRVVSEYYALMASRKDELSFEDRVLLRRLEGLARTVGGAPSSVPPKAP